MIEFRRGRYNQFQFKWDKDERLPSGRWRCRLDGCQAPAAYPFKFYCGTEHREAFLRWLFTQIPPMWDTIRDRAKDRDGYKCVRCGSTDQLEVDHIRPVACYPELEFELSNLRTLCHDCHARHGARPQSTLYRAANAEGQANLDGFPVGGASHA